MNKEPPACSEDSPVFDVTGEKLDDTVGIDRERACVILRRTHDAARQLGQ